MKKVRNVIASVIAASGRTSGSSLSATIVRSLRVLQTLWTLRTSSPATTRPKHARHLISFLHLINFTNLFLFQSCTLTPELEVCPYNVYIEYVRSDGQTTTVEDFPAAGIRQFVYDSTNLLVGEFPGDPCRAGVGTFHLPPGKYTLIAWANNHPNDYTLLNVSPGTSHLLDGQLQPWTRDNRSRHGEEAPHYLCVGRLFHAETAFTVPPLGVTRVKVGLMHAHARLNLTIEWTDGAKPAAVNGTSAPVMCIEDIALGYRFTGGSTWGDYVFPCIDQSTGKGTYTAQAGIQGDKVNATFTTLRLTDDNHPTVHLTRDGVPMMTPVDLSKYFRDMNIGLTNNIRQEFDLTIQIGKDQTYIFQTNTSGWEEGGSIGTD